MSNRVASVLVFTLGLSLGCTSSDVTTTDAVLRSFAVIYGVVSAPDGQPVAGATVQMRENVRAAAVTSTTGRFRLSVETHVLVPVPQTGLFVIVAPAGSSVRDTTERHARVALFEAEPVADSTYLSLVADQRR